MSFVYFVSYAYPMLIIRLSSADYSDPVRMTKGYENRLFTIQNVS